MKWLKIIAVNLIIFVGLFFVFEGGTRLFYPEFIKAVDYDIDDYTRVRHSNLHHHNYLKPDEKKMVVRLPYKTDTQFQKLKSQQKRIGIIGDSVTYGHGLAYEDIFYVRMQRMLNLVSKTPPLVTSMGNIAANYKDTLAHLKNLLKFHNGEFETVIYQFNFNDITPLDRKKIKSLKNNTTIASISLISIYKSTMQWWHAHLFPSAFLRAVQHVGGKLNRTQSGTCKERGFSALNQYSWAYGSKAIPNEGDKIWQNFDSFLQQMKALTNQQNAKLIILISPLMYHIDKQNFHPSYDHLNLDFSCASIKPTVRLKNLAEKNDIKILDPTDYVKRGFEARIEEGNGKPFYFIGDDNHPNALASEYIAEYLTAHFLKQHIY